MKTNLFAAFAALAISFHSVVAGNVNDTIEVLRATYKADRQAILAETLQLTETESAAFWPLYRAYRADMDQIGDGLVKLVLEYGDVYPDMSESRAAEMLKEYLALEQKLASKRATYLKRAAKVLPATKTLRWAQLESRLDLALRLQLAGAIPMVPTPEAKP
ncbi:MAG: hypothetical protein IPM17_15585 [Verrucomicrobia bacterium]|nr:hypothetical protein [Verrucomicrobiota bacterium]